MATALSTIKTRLTYRLKDINDIVDAKLCQMASDLNQLLYKEMADTDPERFISTQSYTVSTSPSTQALPTSFRDVQNKGCGFFIQNTDGTASNTQLIPTGYGSKDLGYYISGANVIFTGINSTQTIVLRYVPVLADITTVAGTFCVPDENKELLTEGMVLYYYRYNEDNRQSNQELEFDRQLTLFREGLPKDVNIGLLPSKLLGTTVSVRNDIPVY